MSDLDIDAIRRRLERSRAFVSEAELSRRDIYKPRRAAYITVVNDVPALLAEVERLRAQLVGGEWVTRYRTLDDYAALAPGPGVGIQHVWYGPIAEAAE